MSYEFEKTKDYEIRYGDCLELMKDFPDNHFELGLTDPPYNIDAGLVPNHHGESRRKDVVETYDDLKGKEEYYKWCETWYREFIRVCERIIFTCGSYNIHFWTDEEKFPEFKGVGVWHIPNSSSRDKHTTFKRWEPLICCGDFGKKRLHGDVIKAMSHNGFLNKKSYVHPHPKPPELYEKIIDMQQPRNVLDPFLGSGTTVRVCIQLGVPVVGIELNKEKYESDIEERIKEGYENRITGDDLFDL